MNRNFDSLRIGIKPLLAPSKTAKTKKLVVERGTKLPREGAHSHVMWVTWAHDIWA